MKVSDFNLSQIPEEHRAAAEHMAKIAVGGLDVEGPVQDVARGKPLTENGGKPIVIDIIIERVKSSNDGVVVENKKAVAVVRLA